MVAHARGVWRDTFRSEFVQIIGDSPSLAEAVLNAHLCLPEFSLYGPAPHEETEAFARELLGMADGRGSAIGAAMATLMLGEVELLSGRLDEAEGELTLAADLAARSGGSSVHAMATERLGEVAVARNDRRLWEARAHLRLADDDPLRAAALFREAAEAFARAGHPLAEARCRAAAESADSDAAPRNGSGTRGR